MGDVAVDTGVSPTLHVAKEPETPTFNFAAQFEEARYRLAGLKTSFKAAFANDQQLFCNFKQLYKAFKTDEIFTLCETSVAPHLLSVILDEVLLDCRSTSISERLFSIYCLYSLYYRQPFTPKVCIPVSIDTFRVLLSIRLELERLSQYDGCNCIARLHEEKAFVSGVPCPSTPSAPRLACRPNDHAVLIGQTGGAGITYGAYETEYATVEESELLDEKLRAFKSVTATVLALPLSEVMPEQCVPCDTSDQAPVSVDALLPIFYPPWGTCEENVEETGLAQHTEQEKKKGRKRSSDWVEIATIDKDVQSEQERKRKTTRRRRKTGTHSDSL